MKKVTFVALVTMVTLLTCCRPEQIADLDRAAGDANDILSTARTMIESPAGQALPPDWRLYGSLAVAAGSIVLNAYEKWRLQIMTKTTKAIVKGIDQAGKNSPAGNRSGPAKVKDAIGREMRSAGIYDRANKIVNQLKITP